MRLLLRVLALLVGLASAVPAGAQPRAAPTHLGVGVVASVDEQARTLTVTHQPIPSLGMAGMTMDFLVARPVPLRNLKTGDTIAFLLGRAGKGDDVAIVSLQKVDLPGKCPQPTPAR